MESPHIPLPNCLHPIALFPAGGSDNYAGLVIDYRGADVNAETFLAVLTNNASGVAGKGSGKMLESGPNDRVFVFYSGR